MLVMMRRCHVVASCLYAVVLLCGLTASVAGQVYLNVPVTEVVYSGVFSCPGVSVSNGFTWTLADGQTTGLCAVDFDKPYTVGDTNYTAYLFHDRLRAPISHHSVWSVMSTHNLTPLKRGQLYVR